jgi:hypothetical protein
MAASWTLDYCIACERQTAGGAYCSQTCRLADLDPSLSGSEPATPTDARFAPAGRAPSAAFFLPPAFDFAAYRSRPPSATGSRPGSVASAPGGDGAGLARAGSSPRALTPSSSRSSLVSIPSAAAHADALSSQARSDLRDYTNSFDQVRDWRRRRTTS